MAQVQDPTFQFQVNGQPVKVQCPSMKRLLDVLREDLQLTGTKEGCGEGECGACAILVNGKLINSCLVPVAQIHGQSLQTIEGASHTPIGKAVQKAMVTCGGVQCGMCTPGMILAAQACLQSPDTRSPTEMDFPSEESVREALSGNLCRCTGYGKIVEAVIQAAQDLKGTR